MSIKGFTLIELLGVMLLLAFLALIAIPAISKVIDKSQYSSVKRSAELYITAVEQAIMRENIRGTYKPKSCEIQSDGNLMCDIGELRIDADGNRPTEGSLVIEYNEVKTVTGMILEGYELETNEKGKIIVKRVLEDDTDNQ